MNAKRAATDALKHFARFCVLPVVILALNGLELAANAAPDHPLDPLTAEELTVVRDVLVKSGKFSPSTNFIWIELDEPPKSAVEGFRPSTEFPRRAEFTAVDFEEQKTFEVIVDIGGARCVHQGLGDLQPGIDERDVAIAKSVVDADDTIKRALVSRGLKIPGKVSEAVPVLYYSIGHDDALDDNRHRLMRVVFWSDQTATNSSPFLDGIMAVIDLYSRKAIRSTINPACRARRFLTTYSTPSTAAPRSSGPQSGAAETQDFSIDGTSSSGGTGDFDTVSISVKGWSCIRSPSRTAISGGRLYRASVSEAVTAYIDPSNSGRGWKSSTRAVAAWAIARLRLSLAARYRVRRPLSTFYCRIRRRRNFSSTFDKRIYIYQREAAT